jgi:site-specific DNA-methyltransferase (adenine-specific)
MRRLTSLEDVERACTHIDRVEVGEHYVVAQCDHATLAAALRTAGVTVDALIVDAPYSERTHAGHDAGVEMVNLYKGRPSNRSTQKGRRHIDYVAWAAADVESFVGIWHKLTRGWVASLTDHALYAAWAAAMEDAYRYAFSPLACIEGGSRCRLGGDGPSQWATWLVVSRPRTREFQSWGTLPGAYVGPAERRKDVTGGKPMWLMRAIVGDYSAPGDLVCDPCMGAGTTLVAAVELGRRSVGCEPDPGRFAIACKRLAAARPQLRMRLDVDESPREQLSMGDDK